MPGGSLCKLFCVQVMANGPMTSTLVRSPAPSWATAKSHDGLMCRPSSANTPLQAGMVVSNEPGYYEDGKFGIRIENLLVSHGEQLALCMHGASSSACGSACLEHARSAAAADQQACWAEGTLLHCLLRSPFMLADSLSVECRSVRKSPHPSALEAWLLWGSHASHGAPCSARCSLQR